MKTAVLLVAAVPAAVGFIWLLNTVAGTMWSLPFVIVSVGGAFGFGWLSDHRPSASTPLQRFEERQQERRAA